jgi:hypothetical protein
MAFDALALFFDHCGDHGRFWARSRSLARIMQLVASRTPRSLAELGFGFWPFHSNQPRGRGSPTPRRTRIWFLAISLEPAPREAIPDPAPRFCACQRGPARAGIVDSLHKVTFMSPRGRIEKPTFEAWIGAVRCIGVDVLAYSPPPAAML